MEISEESLLCGAIAYVASSRVTPRIQPFQDLERHITFPSHSRTARAWLGHASLATTNVYLEVDLEMKAKALETCEIKEERGAKAWRQNTGVMEFLRNL